MARADGYAVPLLLDAATSILMAYFATSKKLFSQLGTFRRCQEKIVEQQTGCGGFGLSGLSLNIRVFSGIAGCRKFF